MSSDRFCTKCGTPLKEGGKFCAACGSPAAEIKETVSLPSSSTTVKHPMSRKAKLIYSLFALGLTSIFLFIFMNHLPGGGHPVISQQPDVSMPSLTTDNSYSPVPIDATTDGGTISFSLALLLDKRIVEFEYQTTTSTTPLLAFISPQGKLVTAIRMCEPCNAKTFRIEGDELACGNCETRWKLGNLEGIQGSCQKYPPDPIPSQVIGSRVVINEDVVKNWKMRI